MKDRTQLLYLARIDLAGAVTPDPEDPHYEDHSLCAHAVLAGDNGWQGLLKAAEVRQGDHRDAAGYIVKAWVDDPVTGVEIDSMEWLDLCQDQVDRMFQHMYSITAAR